MEINKILEIKGLKLFSLFGYLRSWLNDHQQSRDISRCEKVLSMSDRYGRGLMKRGKIFLLKSFERLQLAIGKSLTFLEILELRLRLTPGMDNFVSFKILDLSPG